MGKLVCCLMFVFGSAFAGSIISTGGDCTASADMSDLSVMCGMNEGSREASSRDNLIFEVPAGPAKGFVAACFSSLQDGGFASASSLGTFGITSEPAALFDTCEPTDAIPLYARRSNPGTLFH